MSLRSRILPLVAALLLHGAGPLAGQSPADRQMLTRLRDSLAAVRDTSSLLALEAATIEVAKRQRDDALIHLRLGLIALRLRELGSRRHLDHAGSEFEWASQLEPKWPWPWYGLGLVDKMGPGQGRYGGGLFTALGLDGESRASEAFAKSIRIDSSFTDGLLGLTEVTLDQKINPPLTTALDAIRAATATSDDPALFLARGRLERLGGHPDSALRVLRVAQTLRGPQEMILLEMARTIPLVPTSFREWLSIPPMDSVYYQGARSDDPEVVALYRMDLAPILDDTALARFDGLRGSARVAWLRDFWSTRDQLDLRPPGSRLAEHYRRWDKARREFPLSPFRRRYARGLETYKSGNRDVDDRGIVYIRQGEPTERIVWPLIPRTSRDTIARFTQLGGLRDSVTGFNAQTGQATTVKVEAAIALGQSNLVQPAVSNNYGNESWVYRRPDGDIILHFAANFDPQDYRLQSNVLALDVAFSEIRSTITAGAYLPGVRRLLDANGGTVDQLLSEERIRGRRDNTTATTTDAWPLEYPRPLPSLSPAWFAAGVRDGKVLTHLVYAMDARTITEQPWRLVPVTLRATFTDPQGRITGRMDTTQRVTHATAGKNVIGIRAEVPLPPGTQRARLGAEITPDLGTVYPTDTLRLPRIDGGVLALSDIIVGRRGLSLPWEPPGADTVWLDPHMSYSPGDTLQVYLEAYGMQPGTPYTAKLTLTKQAGGVSRLLGRKDQAVSLTEAATPRGAIWTFRRSIGLASVGPGDYMLEISLTGKGSTVSARRRVYVAK